MFGKKKTKINFTREQIMKMERLQNCMIGDCYNCNLKDTLECDRIMNALYDEVEVHKK